MSRTDDQGTSFDKPGPATASPEVNLDDPRVVTVVKEYLALLEAGEEVPSRERFLARYPDLAETLAGCLEALEMVHTFPPNLEEKNQSDIPAEAAATNVFPQGTPLGDFRLLRQIGRGGMGIVYEAEQVSIGRRVALKVLPFAAVLDPKQLTRFKNEAIAAGALDHPNIVTVHSVGCDRGVHYYAMQLVEGQSLAESIAQLREYEHEEKGDMRTGTSSSLPSSSRVPAADTQPMGALTTEVSPKSSGYFRTVAQMGVQAAEALQHAHKAGLIHRDIKPSNLLVNSQQHLWVTHFGLAKMPGEATLTLSGDLLGTLRYMSPEQASGKSAVLDCRTDIYSLGATLYELLTLRRAFPGNDRQKLLRQITEQQKTAKALVQSESNWQLARQAYASPTSFCAAPGRRLAPIDFNATTDLVALSASGQLTIALNAGDDRWQSSRIFDPGLGPLAGMKLMNVNLDVSSDLILQGPNSVSIALGNENGQFTLHDTATTTSPGSLSPSGGGAVQMDASLLSDDLFTDIVTVAPGTNEVLVFLTNGAGRGDGRSRFRFLTVLTLSQGAPPLLDGAYQLQVEGDDPIQYAQMETGVGIASAVQFQGSSAPVSGSLGRLVVASDPARGEQFRWFSSDSVLGPVDTGLATASLWRVTGNNPQRLVFRATTDGVTIQGNVLFGDRHDAVAYQYAGAAARRDGHQSADASVPLDSANHNPEGSADPDPTTIIVGQVVTGSIATLG